eukprot:GILI01001593.1.p1 GENE.GILI01001593.1~~GILI01001593.1.p1  ORF type:complete len:185 (-),score=75.24 GILI01001593.1:285-773(-)
MAESQKLKLSSAEGTVFEVESEVAMMSQLVKNMVEDSGVEEEIPLPGIKAEVLTKILEYLKHHHANPAREIQKPLQSPVFAENVGDWDAAYIDVDQTMLYEVIMAANYLDIKSLLDLSCAKVASMIKDQPPEKIRETFNIVGDFTPEEEAKIREENPWIDEL